MRKTLLTLALTALVGPVFAKPASESVAPLLKAGTSEAEAAVWATRFLTHFHYKQTPLDDAMSEQIFKRYFDALDGDRLFFTQATHDVDGGVCVETLVHHESGESMSFGRLFVPASKNRCSPRPAVTLARVIECRPGRRHGRFCPVDRRSVAVPH